MRQPIRAVAVLTSIAGLMLASAGAAAAWPATAWPARIASADTGNEGQVGAYRFSDTKSSGATCHYSAGRLRSITVAPPRAAGRRQWEPTGQYVDWTATLQRSTDGVHWHNAGVNRASGTRLVHVGHLTTLPARTIPNIAGNGQAQYRVRETIEWLRDDTTTDQSQGHAWKIVSHYHFSGALLHQSSCDALLSPTLATIPAQAHNELDTVSLALHGHEQGAKVHYSVIKGALPAGLSLNASTGKITGTIAWNAVNLTTDYTDPKSAVIQTTVAAIFGGRLTSRTISWTVHDTAFQMPNYFDTFGSTPYDVNNLGTHSFACTTDQNGSTNGLGVIVYQNPAAGTIQQWGIGTFTFYYYEDPADCKDPQPIPPS